MRWVLFDVYIQRRHSTAEALRAYSELVYLFEHFALHIRIKRLGVSYFKIPAKRLFCKYGRQLKVAADTDAHRYRRTWIASCL